MRRTTAAAGLLVAAVLVGGGAAAAVGTATPAVDACYATVGGQLRVDVGGGCRPNETPIRLGGAAVSTRVVTATETLSGVDWIGVEAMCAAGEVVTGGGYEIGSISPLVAVNQNQPVTIDGIQGWQVAVGYSGPVDDGHEADVVAFAVCVPGP